MKGREIDERMDQGSKASLFIFNLFFLRREMMVIFSRGGDF